jgi:uncharacterized membrane protein
VSTAISAGRDTRIDLARGIAVIAMVIYHFTWDLAAFGLIDPATATSPGFRRLGATIAGSFLLLSGIALVLARHAVPDDVAWRAKFLKRLGIIAAAAAVVSLGTWFAMGDRFVRFGILHCIAASSLICWPFLRRPAWVAAAAAVVVVALPWGVDIPAFSHPALLWAGLSAAVPAMVDYVPVFPFAGMALLGVAAGHLMLAARDAAVPVGASDGWLARLGRLSLPIYLLHQPVLYGGLFLVASLMAPSNRPADVSGLDRDTAGFRTECRRACEGLGNTRAHCDRYCTCAETEMKSTGLWSKVMASSTATVVQPELAPMLQACFAKAQAAP